MILGNLLLDTLLIVVVVQVRNVPSQNISRPGNDVKYTRLRFFIFEFLHLAKTSYNLHQG